MHFYSVIPLMSNKQHSFSDVISSRFWNWESFKLLCPKQFSVEAKESLISFFPNLKDFVKQCIEKECSKHHWNIDLCIASLQVRPMTPGFHRYLSQVSNFHSTSKEANVNFTFRTYTTVALTSKLQKVVSSSWNGVFDGSYAFLLIYIKIFILLLLLLLLLLYLNILLQQMVS
jgi:hypothetical protein